MSPAVTVSDNFFGHTIPLGNLRFWPKIKVNFFWIFFHKSVLGSPDITLGNFKVHPSARSQAETSGKLAWTPYFNKLLPSIFYQVRRQERAILASTYYTGCVHSILSQNFDVARRRHFGQFFQPYYMLRFNPKFDMHWLRTKQNREWFASNLKRVLKILVSLLVHLNIYQLLCNSSKFTRNYPLLPHERNVCILSSWT